LTEPRALGQEQLGQERQGLSGTWLGFAWNVARLASPTTKANMKIEMARIRRRQGSSRGAFMVSVVMWKMVA
jgi:hypothetical protein